MGDVTTTGPDTTETRAGAPFGVRVARLRRDPDDRVVAGVCAALARELGIDPIILRVAAIGTALAGGTGIALYLIGWLVIPPLGEEPRAAATPARARDGARPWRVVVGLAMIVLALLLGARRFDFLFSDVLVWPAVLAAVGAAVIWYRSTTGRSAEAGAAEAAREERRAVPVTPTRLAVGGGLVIAAVVVFLLVTGAVGGVRQTVTWTAALVVAAALILGPVVWRFAASFGEERAERIRTQERAEVAAHLHDSVLQTLALMQRQADDPRAVATLARRQERELRAWLWGSDGEGPQRFAAALQAAAAEVEAAHDVPVDVVAVGDRDLDRDAAAVVAAAREAMINAAKFAGEGPVSVYAEAGAGDLEVFVRDRGAGFDPERIPDGRHGVRDSIVGRIERHGGRAAVHSGPDGTEVEIVLPGGER